MIETAPREKRKVRWGILATGTIAHDFARAIMQVDNGRLVAVGSRSRESADQFGETFSIQRRHADYQRLIDDPQVEAVYIASPHSTHARWAIAAARAGKHVLCEKPLAVNYAEAMAITDAAETSGVAVLEGFMYSFHPQTRKLIELISAGTIGEVKMLNASYLFDAVPDRAQRLFDAELGGGSILDVGCYCIHLARQVGGAVTGRQFDDPVQTSGCAIIGETGVDEHAAALLQFSSGLAAQLVCGIRLPVAGHIRIIGTNGELSIKQPAWYGGDSHPGPIELAPHDGNVRTVAVDDAVSQYALEAEAMADGIDDPVQQRVWREDALGNMSALDSWRAQGGVVFPSELPRPTTVAGDRLAPSAQPSIPVQGMPGVDTQVSRIVLGGMTLGVNGRPNYPHAAAMFDRFAEHGGTTIDTAWIYGVRDGDGLCETLLGQWLESRGVRAEIAILGKGAHTPYCQPESVRPQLWDSLERLRTDYIDIYMLHRDNPDYPAGEFIEALNDVKRAGLVRIFGASNWSLERVKEAQQYAREHGLAGFAAVSNQFSLADMIEPPWEGCYSASASEWRVWLTDHQLPLMTWSTLAQGFLALPAEATSTNPDLVRCWHSPANLARLRRLRALAAEKTVSPAALALAYVLHQPFSTFALIGPTTLRELRMSLAAVDIALSDAEIAYLERGEGR